MKITQINQLSHNQTDLSKSNPFIMIKPNTILSKKYSSFINSYDNIQISNLIFNEKCRVVGIFKDYLILDDSTEFLRRYYSSEENPPRLSRIFSFYETYSKIFPNYMILPESAYLYRNIRKKQKMIDAFNQIKREEEENRLNLNLEKKTQKNGVVIFDDSLQDAIKKCEPSQSKAHMNDNDESLNSFSISVSMKRLNHNFISSSPTRNNLLNEESNISLAMILNTLNKQNESEFIAETPKKIKKIEYNNPPLLVLKNNGNNDKDKESDSQQTLSALNNNRKFISHKAAVSVPEIQNKEIKIINNYHNIILPQGTNTVININTHYYQATEGNWKKNINGDNNIATSLPKNEKKSISPTQKTKNMFTKDQLVISTRQKSLKQTNFINNNNNNNTNGNNNINKTNNITKKNSSKSKPHEAKSLKKEQITIERKSKDFGLVNSFKSPEKKLNDFPISLSKNNTKTADSGNHMMAFYKNKQITSSTLTELQNKVNPFKIKFKRKYQLKNNNKDKVSSLSSSKKSYDIPQTKKKEIKITLLTEEDKEKNTEETEQKFFQTDEDQKMSQNEMKQRYKTFMEKAKKDANTMRISCDSNRKQTNTIDNGYRYPSSNTFASISTQRKTQNLKSSLPKKILLSPKMMNYNTVETKMPLATKVMLNSKVILKKELFNTKKTASTSTTVLNTNNPSKIIKSINFKSFDSNTKQMKFIKK